MPSLAVNAAGSWSAVRTTTRYLFSSAKGDTLAAEIDVRLGEGPINSLRIANHPGHECEIFAACYSSRIVRVSRQR